MPLPHRPKLGVGLIRPSLALTLIFLSPAPLPDPGRPVLCDPVLLDVFASRSSSPRRLLSWLFVGEFECSADFSSDTAENSEGWEDE